MHGLSSVDPGLYTPLPPYVDSSSPQAFPPVMNPLIGVAGFNPATEYGIASLNPQRFSPITLGPQSEPGSPAGSIQGSPFTPLYVPGRDSPIPAALSGSNVAVQYPSKRSMAESTSPIPSASSQAPAYDSRSMEDVLAYVKTHADYILKDHAHKLDRMEWHHVMQKHQLNLTISHMEERLTYLQQLFRNNEQLLSQVLRERQPTQALPKAKRQRIKKTPALLPSDSIMPRDVRSTRASGMVPDPAPRIPATCSTVDNHVVTQSPAASSQPVTDFFGELEPLWDEKDLETI